MNRINHKYSRRALFAINWLLAASLVIAGTVETSNAGTSNTGASIAEASEIQVGRYQSVKLQLEKTQVDLLSVVVTRELPKHIETVGQAVTLLLEGSGYRLLSARLAQPYRVWLFALPLPQVQRQLGPMSLRQALELLAGPAFRLVIDPTYRLLSFELVATSTMRENHACFTI